MAEILFDVIRVIRVFSAYDPLKEDFEDLKDNIIEYHRISWISMDLERSWVEDVGDLIRCYSGYSDFQCVRSP